MCGRFAVSAKSITPAVSERFNIDFTTTDNMDLRPTDIISTVIKSGAGYQQLNASWGIKPSWSKTLLINAQSETVSSKRTFKESFALRRCLVPCTGWYEWTGTKGNKAKNYFSQASGEPLYMAGVWFEGEQKQLVTLTTKPNEKCAEYHHRMPVIVLPENVDYWLSSEPETLEPFMLAIEPSLIEVSSR